MLTVLKLAINSTQFFNRNISCPRSEIFVVLELSQFVGRKRPGIGHFSLSEIL